MGRLGAAWRGLVTGSAELVPVTSPATVESLPPEIAAAFGVPGIGDEYVTRREAMGVPAMKRGRAVIAGTIGTFPLVAVREGTTERVRQRLLDQPDPNTTRQHVLTWTVDDLIFYGIAWWWVTGWGADGFPVTAVRVPPGAVTFVNGRPHVNGHPVDDRQLKRFDGPDEGILNVPGGTLRTCVMLAEAVRRFAKMDIPLGLLEAVEGSPPLTDPEVDDLLDRWETWRRRRNTGYLNSAIKYRTVGFDANAIQLTEGRQFCNSEIARMLNLPGRYVGASDGDSLTYATTQGNRLDLIDISLAQWMTAIEQRLSLPDMTPRGQVVRFDTAAFVRGDLATAVDTGTKAIAAGIVTPAEVRSDLYARPALDEPAPTTPPEVAP